MKAPLGLLWYGGSSNKQILPRHRHGPSEHVVGGRLFIEGPDLIRAVDVYTGRMLWQADLPGLGHAFAKFPIFRANEAHEPGAITWDPILPPPRTASTWHTERSA